MRDTSRSPTKIPRWRIVLRFATSALLLAVTIDLLGEWDMARERKARAYLGDRLYTDVRGKTGPPVVFLAGLQGSTCFWGHAFDRLAMSHRLIFTDELGFGRSPWPEHTAYTLDDQVGALRRTLVAADATTNVTFVAHSFGTVLAAAYAARYPKDVRRLVLIGTPVWRSPAEGRLRIRQMTALGAVFTFNHALAKATCMTMCAARPLLRAALPAFDRERPPDVVRDSVLHVMDSVDGAVGILMTTRIAPFVCRLGTRVTLVHGRSDAVSPLQVVQTLAHESGARLVVVDSAHHDYLQRVPNVIANEITRPDGDQ